MVGIRCKICGKDRKANFNATYYKFPESPERLNKWCEILNLERKKIKKNSAICSDHFDKSQIGYRHLKKGAMPKRNGGVWQPLPKPPRPPKQPKALKKVEPPGPTSFKPILPKLPSITYRINLPPPRIDTPPAPPSPIPEPNEILPSPNIKIERPDYSDEETTSTQPPTTSQEDTIYSPPSSAIEPEIKIEPLDYSDEESTTTAQQTTLYNTPITVHQPTTYTSTQPSTIYNLPTTTTQQPVPVTLIQNAAIRIVPNFSTPTAADDTELKQAKQRIEELGIKLTNCRKKLKRRDVRIKQLETVIRKMKNNRLKTALRCPVKIVNE